MPRVLHVGGRVEMRRRVAAGDVAARQAHAQMNPLAAHLETFLASRRRAMKRAGHRSGDVAARIREVDRVVVVHVVRRGKMTTPRRGSNCTHLSSHAPATILMT